MKAYILNNKAFFALTILAVLLEVGTNIFVALALKDIVDVAVKGDLGLLKQTMLRATFIFIANYVAVFFRRLFEAGFLKKVMSVLKGDIFASILKKSIPEVFSDNSSKYISVINNDLSIIEQDYFVTIFTIVGSVFSFILASITVIQLSTYIAVLVFVLSVVLIVVPQIFNQRLSTAKNEFSGSLQVFTTKIKDMLLGFEVIKSFNIQDKIFGEYNRHNCKVEEKKYQYALLNNVVVTIIGFLGFLMFFSAISAGAYLAVLGKVSIGTMIAAVQLMNYILYPAQDITSGFNRINSVKLILKKIKGILDVTDNLECGVEKKSFEQAIEFRNISFSYEGERSVLNKVSLNVKKGSKTAIVGLSGSGKSTILKLLLRYYENFSGQILLDGTDIREIRSTDLYKLMSVIHQNVFLFDGTLKDNITLYSDQYSAADLWTALQLSGLAEFVDALPDSENTYIEENGYSMSGGERQRLAIARALIRQTPILVLDEITSALDNQTAYQIEKSLLEIENLTAIIVTHKLYPKLLQTYDSIVVLKDGQIVEQGTLEQLLDVKGYFYSMYTIQ